MRIALLNGDVINSYNGYQKFTSELIGNLSKKYSVHLINYKGPKTEESEIQRKLASYHTMVEGEEGVLSKRIRQLQSFLSKESMVPRQFKEMNINELNDRLKEIDPNIIMVNQLRAAWAIPYLSSDLHASIIYISHTCESHCYHSVAKNQDNKVIRMITKIEADRILELERKVLQRVQYCVSFTPEDAQRMKKINPRPRHIVIPPGTDIPEYIPENTGELSLLLVGSYQWNPKRKYAIWLANEVLPLVNQGTAKVKLILVGQDATQLKEAIYNKEMVEIHSDVPSTLPYYQENMIFTIPDRHESGLKIKTLEAASFGLSIVSTPAGIEGSLLINEESCLIANTKEEFAKVIQRLIANTLLRKKLGEKARKEAIEYFRWEVISGKYHRLIHEAATSSTV
jgi:glycosyltransferase involved in cell wall biosynthesis